MEEHLLNQECGQQVSTRTSCLLTCVVTKAILRNTHTKTTHSLYTVRPTWRVDGGNTDGAPVGWGSSCAASAGRAATRLTQWKEVVCFHRRLKNKVV